MDTVQRGSHATNPTHLDEVLGLGRGGVDPHPPRLHPRRKLQPCHDAAGGRRGIPLSQCRSPVVDAERDGWSPYWPSPSLPH